MKILNYVSPEYSPVMIPAHQRTLKKIYYLEYCSSFVCVLRAPDDKPRLVALFIAWSFHVC